MKKNFLTILFFTIFLYSPGHTASTGGSTSKVDNFKKASNLVKQAKKYELKGKENKAKKKFEKALKLLLIANKEKPNQPNTLNYLGFTSRKIGNFKIAEEYYLEGLAIDPDHFGINEYLGELYVNTDRISKAKERLKVLENCNCEEFKELSDAIKQGGSKY